MAVVATLLLASCGWTEEVSITVSAGAQAGDLVDLEPCTFTLLKEDYAADCGTLIVPENRSDSTTRLIALPVIRIKVMSNTPAEPVYWVSGGPGHDNITSYSMDGLTDNHDFVMVGYPGGGENKGRPGERPRRCPAWPVALVGDRRRCR